jgi:hypothetical protein
MDLSVVPTLILSNTVTVPVLRAVGARMQNDLILLVQWSDENFREYHTFGKDKARSVTSIEAMLLDVRTGLIPFSSAVTENFTVQETDQDLSYWEAEAKARQAAFERAMAKLGDGLVSFLKDVP